MEEYKIKYRKHLEDEMIKEGRNIFVDVHSANILVHPIAYNLLRENLLGENFIHYFIVRDIFKDIDFGVKFCSSEFITKVHEFKIELNHAANPVDWEAVFRRKMTFEGNLIIHNSELNLTNGDSIEEQLRRLVFEVEATERKQQMTIWMTNNVFLNFKIELAKLTNLIIQDNYELLKYMNHKVGFIEYSRGNEKPKIYFTIHEPERAKFSNGISGTGDEMDKRLMLHLLEDVKRIVKPIYETNEKESIGFPYNEKELKKTTKELEKKVTKAMGLNLNEEDGSGIDYSKI